MGDAVLWMKTKPWMTEKLPEFYRETFNAWGMFLKRIIFNPHGREKVLTSTPFLKQKRIKTRKRNIL